jgi:hypothetical protein
MVKISALALGLLALASEVCAQKTVKVMPFGASIVSVCSRLPDSKSTHTNSHSSDAGGPTSKHSSERRVSQTSTLSVDKNPPAVEPTLIKTTKATLDSKPST